MGTPPVPRRVPLKPAPGRAGRRGLCLVCALAFSVLWPGAGTAGELAWGAVATPLRIVNLNPFQLLYGVPGSLGARVMTPGSSAPIATGLHCAIQGGSLSCPHNLGLLLGGIPGRDG